MTVFTRFRIKDVGRNGKGLFADNDIKRGGKILDFPGKIVPEEKTGTWDLQIGKNKFIQALRRNQVDNYLNHSCEPNSFVKKIGRKFYLLSLKDIEKGEEITFDYDTTDYDNERFRLLCGCKSRRCRRAIRGFKYLNAQQKKKLERYLIPYLKKIYKKENLHKQKTLYP